MFALPSIFGLPAITQDNQIQNFPLRVLSGQQLRTLHLPLFNGLANSGTPLLGGMNSGSLYPLTLLFAFLPSLLAWALNVVAVYVSAGIGVYALVRWLRLRPSAAFFAAIVYTYAGAMLGQLVHLAVVQGFALLPWMVLIQLHLSRVLIGRRGETSHFELWRKALPGITGLGVIWGLTFLTGEPRSIAELELLALIVVATEMVLHNGVAQPTWVGRLRVLVANGIGVVWGVAIGLVQMLPGWAFIGQSQRADITYWFFGSGSLQPKWTALLLAPESFGGNSALGVPHFFMHYNLAEVSGYVGVVALTGVAAFFAQLTRRGWVGEHRVFTVFGVMVVVGLLATWGSYTPLGHLFHEIPLFGRTRLQSRNIVIVDFAAAVLLGWWMDAMTSGRRREAAVEGFRRYVTAIPALLVVLWSGALLVAYRPILTFMDATDYGASLGSGLRWPMVIHLILGLGVLAVIVASPLKVRPRRWLIAIMMTDLLLLTALCSLSYSYNDGNIEPSPSALAVLPGGHPGRMAILDSGLTDFQTYVKLGAPNLNVFTKQPSVQGYGSLISAYYGNVTGTHPLLGLDSCQLARGRFAQLNLRTILASVSSLSEPIPPTWPATSTCGGLNHPSSSVHRYFGQELAVTSFTASTSLAKTTFTVDILPAVVSDKQSASAVSSFTIASDGYGVIKFVLPNNAVRPLVGAGIALEPWRPTGSMLPQRAFTISSLVVGDAEGRAFELNEPYQIALHDAGYVYSGTVGSFAVFHGAGTPALRLDGAGQLSHHRTATWGDEWANVSVDQPTTLIRSSSWLPGWKATASNTLTGESVALKVERHDLIQSVRVPAGHWAIHFHYHAPYIGLGVLSSVAGTLLVIVSYVVIRRQRSREVGE